MKKRLLLPLLAAALLPAAAVADDPVPALLSKESFATMHRSNGNVNNDAFGGGTGMGNFFQRKNVGRRLHRAERPDRQRILHLA